MSFSTHIFYQTKDIAGGFSINFIDVPFTQSLGEMLRSTTAMTWDLGQYNVTVDEDTPITYKILEKDLLNGAIGELGSGEKVIIKLRKENEVNTIKIDDAINTIKECIEKY